MFVIDLWQKVGSLQVFQFPPLIKLNTLIYRHRNIVESSLKYQYNIYRISVLMIRMIASSPVDCGLRPKTI